MSDKDKIKRMRAVIKKIAYQINDTAEDKLFFAVIVQAIHDACLRKSMVRSKKTGKLYDTNKNNRMSGRYYLRGEMIHASMIGLDPEWVRKLLKNNSISIK